MARNEAKDSSAAMLSLPPQLESVLPPAIEEYRRVKGLPAAEPTSLTISGVPGGVKDWLGHMSVEFKVPVSDLLMSFAWKTMKNYFLTDKDWKGALHAAAAQEELRRRMIATDSAKKDPQDG